MNINASWPTFPIRGSDNLLQQGDIDVNRNLLDGQFSNLSLVLRRLQCTLTSGNRFVKSTNPFIGSANIAESIRRIDMLCAEFLNFDFERLLEIFDGCVMIALLGICVGNILQRVRYPGWVLRVGSVHRQRSFEKNSTLDRSRTYFEM